MFASPLRHFVLACIAALALPAASAAEDVLDLAGIYEIRGETVVEGQPDRFSITGKLVLKQNGSDFTSAVEAAMRREGGESGPSSTALIGIAEFKLDGRKFTGTGDLQSLVSQVPELDVAMPFTPRMAGPVLDSVAEGEVLEDGTLVMEVRSEVIGEGFTLPEGRKTTVRATRVARKPTELKKSAAP
ncbi:MAG: hypothetical protein ABFS41_01900 [Myxococcota bacterium]